MTAYADQYVFDPAFKAFVDRKVEASHGQAEVEAAALRVENQRLTDMLDAQRVQIQQLQQQLEQKQRKGKK